MSTKYVFPIALIVVLLILGGVYLAQPKISTALPTVATSEVATTTQTEDSAPTPAAKPTVVAPAPSPTLTGFTRATVATHASSASCWTIVNGSVYDVTAWIGKHPGGADAILSLCGKDGTVAFEGQHGGQRRPEAELASFKIGALVK